MTDQHGSFHCPECGAATDEQRWKLAASGTGFIGFKPGRVTRQLRVLLSKRAPIVGEGYGITGGGFVNCVAIERLPFFEPFETALAAYREGDEENPGFSRIMTREGFLERAQPLPPIHVHREVTKHDPSRVHSCNYAALRLTDYEWEQLLLTPSSSERIGQLRDCLLTWTKKITRDRPERFVIIRDGARLISARTFYHQHEMHALGLIAYYAERGKLW